MKILVQNGDYTFTAAAKTLSLDNYVSIDIENVLLVTNVVDNIIIYNFADPSKGGTVAGNVLTLTYDTTTMADTDELQIWYWDTTATQSVSGTVAVTGALTDVELRATPVPVSGTVTTTDPNVYTEDQALPSNPLGNQLMARRRDSLVNEVSADGDAIALNSTERGELLAALTDLAYVLRRNFSVLSDLGETVRLGTDGKTLNVDLSSSDTLGIVNTVSIVTTVGTMATLTNFGQKPADMMIDTNINISWDNLCNRITIY